ncbi:conserved hypothetical protein [Hyphomicrobiales bacterium]|nr:conserved hypothetical protein [Hyphomicrobiales bacterium]CAH1699467.1 hypothetical protein BOSEA1005_12520 [Hyphomicrobiales bacterium]CAI0343254.1 conserved hypothetical protein [Hyphomicrobiales bacterium]
MESRKQDLKPYNALKRACALRLPCVSDLIGFCRFRQRARFAASRYSRFLTKVSLLT